MIAHANQTANMLESGKKSLLKPWFEKAPWRLDQEKALLEAEGFQLDEVAFENESSVQFTGALKEFPDRRLILTFPDCYPSGPPVVSDDGKCSLLTRHQKPDDRIFCLFGGNGKSWYAKLNSVDVLREVRRLLQDAQHGFSQDSDDTLPEPISAKIMCEIPGIVMIPPRVAGLLPKNGGKIKKGTFRIRFPSVDNSKTPQRSVKRGVVSEAKFHDCPEATKGGPIYEKIVDSPTEQRGELYYLPTFPAQIHDTKGVLEELNRQGISLLPNYAWLALIVPEENGNRGEKRFAWLLFHQTKKQPLKPVKTVTHHGPQIEPRLPNLGWLWDKRVGIIGCGAIGSLVAANLASTGMGGFMLVDPDHMEPSNAIRHAVGVDQFGIPKVSALGNRLAQINPELVVEDRLIAFPIRFGFTKLPHKDREKLIQEVSKCDLIIQATGLDSTSRYLNEIGFELGIPVVHVSVTNGAWSGEIVRSIPGKTPCWLCWDSEYGDQASSPPGEPAPEEAIFGVGCDQPTFTGTVYDVGMTANLACQFAVDTLNLVKSGSSDFAGDYLVWRGGDKHGKRINAMEVKQIHFRGDSEANGCSFGCHIR